MNGFLITGIVLMGCGIAAAKAYPYQSASYSQGSAHSAYPPGCITVPVRQLDLYGDNVALVLEKTTDMAQVSGEPIPVHLQIFRVACAEAGRSVILVQFSFTGQAGDVPLPDFFARLSSSELDSEGDDRLNFQLKPEPNTQGPSFSEVTRNHLTFGDYSNGWATEQISQGSWLFVLDLYEVEVDWRVPELSHLYNARLELSMDVGKGSEKLGFIPSTQEVLAPNTVLPLNGRLSGNWIEPGTRDQGFLLSISTPVPPPDSLNYQIENAENADLLAFLAWYTFDASGRMLWLTASGLTPQGSDSVSLDIVRVEDGSFMGSEQAQRAMVGSGRLRARNCNLLEFDYDLNSLGLGSGTISLTRVFELEIDGYNCRDYPARLESLYGQVGD